MAAPTPPEPIVRTDEVQQIADDFAIIPDHGVGLVPNIGLIGGERAVLVVDTGMGPKNAERVLARAQEFAQGRRLYLTTTHFHPEHAFGADVFAGEATYIVNRAQARDLADRGAGYATMFRNLGDTIARQLEGVRIPVPDVVYDGGLDLNLGGRTVELRATGQAHTMGDQAITVPDAGALFTGDLSETAQFPIFPFFPPHDVDVSGPRWIDVLDRLIRSAPRVVIPGHGAVGGVEILSGTRAALVLLRDETWRRRETGLDEQQVIDQVTAAAVERFPDWINRHWISNAVRSLSVEPGASAA